MAILCRGLGLLYILNPATGSTATGTLLLEHYGGEWLPAEDLPGAARKHSTLRELLEAGVLSPAEREQLCVATAVRNPYDRLVSIHAKRRRVSEQKLADPDSWQVHLRRLEVRDDVRRAKGQDFPTWIRRRFVRNWALRTVLGRAPSAYDRFVDGVDVVLRFERLQADFDDLIRSLGGEPVPIPRVNVSPERERRDYRTEYDRLSRLLVRIGQRADIERYQYAFDPPVPLAPGPTRPMPRRERV